MKILELRIETRFPRGYAGGDPRLLTGTAEIQVGINTYDRATYQLPQKALDQIKALVLKSFIENADKVVENDLLFTSEDDLPPAPEPEPEVLTPPAIADEDPL